MTRAGLYHHKGGGRYYVSGTVRNSTNGPSEGQVMVEYHSLLYGTKHVREEGQFHELVLWPDNTYKPRFVHEEILNAP